ncbi:MAG: hypothetical protein JSV51_04180 [Candidatus Bathyarchaeota archaeon]|nr:MAG: hypothetical protein JSV51_04180 [Candidatus Bathyarchaeota archaeon]
MEVRAYSELNLSFLCPSCRDFLATDDYSEFVRRRKKCVKEVRGGMTRNGLRVSLGRPRECHIFEELLMIPVIAIGVFACILGFSRGVFWGVLALLLTATIFIGGFILIEKLENCVHPVKTKIRWIENQGRTRIIVIHEKHMHGEVLGDVKVFQ